MKKIVTATTNEGKVEATRRAVESCLEDTFTIVPVAAESGVAPTPTSDEEGLLGCANRLESAKELIPDASIYIAMEGVLVQVGSEWFVRGWTLLEDTELDRKVTASGASVQVPHVIASQIAPGGEFNHLVRDTYPLNDEEREALRNIGANGAFSGGEYQRQDMFYDGVRICLAMVNNERNWD